MEKASLLICVGIALILSKYSQALEISQCTDADHIEDQNMEGNFQQCILQDNTQDEQVYGQQIEASITMILDLRSLTELWLNQTRIVIKRYTGETISRGQEIFSAQDIGRWKIKFQFEQFRNGWGILKILLFVVSADYNDSQWLHTELEMKNDTITTPFGFWFPVYGAPTATGDNFEAVTTEPDHSEMTTVEHSCSEELESEREKNWKLGKELEEKLKIITGECAECITESSVKSRENEKNDEKVVYRQLSIICAYLPYFNFTVISLGFATFGLVKLYRYCRQETWIMHGTQPNEVKTIKPRTTIIIKQENYPESQQLNPAYNGNLAVA